MNKDFYKKQVAELLNLIKEQKKVLDSEANRLRTQDIIDAFDQWNYNSWCLSVTGDSLVRLKILIEQAFNFIETIGVIAVARYILELSIWLNLFKHNPRYGLVYYHQLLKTQKLYYTDYRSQLVREVDFLKQIEEKEQKNISSVYAQIQNISDLAQLKNAFINTSNSIDAEMARHFSIYSESAKINGYGYQAYQIENIEIKKIDKSLSDIESVILAFDSNVSQEVKDLIPKRWQWRQMAEKVNSVNEYDFIYAFSSKLLHATPVSITTDQKNLEYQEMVIFFKYIHIKIMDIIDIAHNYP